MKKRCSIVLIGMIALSFISSSSALQEEKSNVLLKKVNVQTISLGSVHDDKVIEVYVDNGWVYNVENNQLSREVTYEDEVLRVANEKLQTNEQGEISIPVDNQKIAVEVESAQNKTKYELLVDTKKAREIIIYEDIDINGVIAQMQKPSEKFQTKIEEGKVEWNIDYKNKKPAKGQKVHCNRFNGYLGNGKFVESHVHPQALLNFVQSDCDVSLIWHVHCLSDYQSNLSKRYCSTYSDAKAATCSKLVGHSRGYHKHTGFFSPSK